MVGGWLNEFYGGRAEPDRVLSLLAFQEWFELYRPMVGVEEMRRAA